MIKLVEEMERFSHGRFQKIEIYPNLTSIKKNWINYNHVQALQSAIELISEIYLKLI